MLKDIISFFHEANRLKRILRSGWVYSGVSPSEVESVADHSYMVTLLTLILSLQIQNEGKKINLEKVLIMALIHDLSEGVSQDIDRRVRKYATNEYDTFKKVMDFNALKALLSNLPENLREVLIQNYKEFMEKKSLEAKIVMEADRLETLLQLNAYTQLGFPKELFSEFFGNFNKEVDSFQVKLIKDITLKLLKESEG